MDPLSMYLALENGKLTRYFEEVQKELHELHEEIRIMRMGGHELLQHIEDQDNYIIELEGIIANPRQTRRHIPARLLRLTAYNFRHHQAEGTQYQPIEIEDSEVDETEYEDMEDDTELSQQ